MYSWLVASNAHTAIMTTDLLLRIRKEKTKKSYSITYFAGIKRIFEIIFLKFGFDNDKKTQLSLHHTLSEHQYIYCPTVDFFYRFYRFYLMFKK